MNMASTKGYLDFILEQLSELIEEKYVGEADMTSLEDAAASAMISGSEPKSCTPVGSPSNSSPSSAVFLSLKWMALAESISVYIICAPRSRQIARNA